MMTIPMEVAVQDAIPMTVEDGSITLDVSIGTAYEVVAGETYDGPYEFTPSEEEQTALTDGKVMDGNVVIHPVPSNYGKVSWDGSNITIE